MNWRAGGVSVKVCTRYPADAKLKVLFVHLSQPTQLRAPSSRSQLLNDNKPNNGNATVVLAVRPWRCFQSKRNQFISLERAFDHQNLP